MLPNIFSHRPPFENLNKKLVNPLQMSEFSVAPWGWNSSLHFPTSAWIPRLHVSSLAFSTFVLLSQWNIFYIQFESKFKNKLIDMKKECIPVGCVPTAAVAATTCQYFGVSVRGVSLLCRGGVCPEGVSVQRGVLCPDGGLCPEGGLHTPHCERNDTLFWKHYLPLRSVINS